MNATFQIMLGSVMLCISAVWHIYALSELIVRLQIRFGKSKYLGHDSFGLTVLIFLAILMAHTVQIYFWAGAFMLLGAVPSFPDAIYFSLVTYTTLGYGDIVLSDAFRIFGAMESVTGVLMFGITTAFLVGYFSSLMQRVRDLSNHNGD